MFFIRWEAISLWWMWYEVYSEVSHGKAQKNSQWREALPVWILFAGKMLQWSLSQSESKIPVSSQAVCRDISPDIVALHIQIIIQKNRVVFFFSYSELSVCTGVAAVCSWFYWYTLSLGVSKVDRLSSKFARISFFS